MADPFLDQLSRFTPDAGHLDRDALLFAAGRSSARPNRGWKSLAIVLAGTQSLSFALLWPTAGPGPGLLLSSPSHVVETPPPITTLEAPPTTAMQGNSTPPSGRLRLHELVPVSPAPSNDDLSLIEAGPPLRAFPLPTSLLN